MIGSETGGYIKVKLYRDGIPTIRFAHALVMEAFVGPRPDGMQTRHLNGNGCDNRLSNLAWGTHVENSADRTLHQTDNAGERSGRAKLTWADVRRIRAEHEPQVRGRGCRVLARKYGVDRSVITRIIKNEIWRE